MVAFMGDRLGDESSGALSGRVAIVTGASRGIGAATATALAASGAAVVLAARSADLIADVADRIAAAGGQALAVPTDVSDADAVRRLIERTTAEFGRLDIAFNNAAGGHHPPMPLADVPVEAYDAIVASAMRGVFLSMKYEIPAMLDSGGGSIINMASTAALHPVAGLTGYVSSKYGVVGLTRTAALDYARQGIRVNALAPGPILTEALQGAGEAARQATAASVPVGRIGSPEEVAAAVLWLSGPHAAFVTGVTIPIDGGMTAGMPPFTRGRPDGPRAG
jgi:NAD(P)-dependent dehydrogenase (short-subunit alcohol dehydrogenase family)